MSRELKKYQNAYVLNLVCSEAAAGGLRSHKSTNFELFIILLTCIKYFPRL